MGRSTYVSPKYPSVLPILPPAILGAAEFDAVATGMRVEGFVGNGDYINLPAAATSGTLDYYNSAGTLQWSKSKTHIHADVDYWVGPIFDDGKIYALGVDTTPTLNKYYLASINAAGSVTTIGSGAQPGSDFTNAATTNWWGVTNGVAIYGASLIQRAAVGSGNLLVRVATSGGCEEMEINIATGAIVSDPAVVDNAQSYCFWKTADGLMCYFSNSSGTYAVDVRSAKQVSSFSADLSYKNFIGWPANGNDLPIQWKDKVYRSASGNPRVLDISALDAWVRELYILGGYTL